MSKAWVDSSEVSSLGGAAKLIIDGVNTAPLWYALSDIPAAKAWMECSQRGVANFSLQGINVVCVDTNIHMDWSEDGVYEPRALIRDIEAVLQANPNALIVTRLHLNPPYWWLRKNRTELVGYTKKECKDGTWEYSVPPLTDTGEYGDRTIARFHLPFEMRASIGSEKWIDDTCDVLRQLCQKLQVHPLGKHLIGIQVAYGHCGEWHMWAGSDYGEAMQRAFVRMLKQSYTPDELSRYYGEGTCAEEINMATKREIDEAFSEPGRILTMDRDARIIDSLRVFSYASAEAIQRLCKCIKESWHGMLTGAFYGYFFSTAGADAAHSETAKLYQDENIDFLAAPCAYGNNKISGNMNMLRCVAESCRLSGKLMLSEMDQGYKAVNWDSPEGAYLCQSEAEYAAIMKRNIVENLLLGCGAWFYDHRFVPSSIYEKEEYWATPERLATVRALRDFATALLARPRVKSTDVLLVVDAEYCYRTRTVSTDFELIDALGKSGVGFDRLFLTDIDKCELARYRCVIFADCVTLGKRRYRRALDLLVKNKIKTVLLGTTPKLLCNADVMEAPVCDPKEWREIFKSAGAHIYTDGGEVVVADGGMVMVHCKEIPQTVLHLPCGDVCIKNEKFSTVVYDCQSGDRLL
jgi:hypothetical protein